MSVLFEDVLRHKTVAKIEDENFIFIRKAIDAKTAYKLEKKAYERAKLGSDVAIYVADKYTNMDFEDDKIRSAKRLKHAVRKLLNLRTNRMLDILGYTTVEKDVRRLEYAIKQFSSGDALLQRRLTQLSFRGFDNDKGGGDSSLQTFFGPESGKVLEDKITQLGMGIPKLD